jgi:hypothetical protein
MAAKEMAARLEGELAALRSRHGRGWCRVASTKPVRLTHRSDLARARGPPHAEVRCGGHAASLNGETCFRFRASGGAASAVSDTLKWRMAVLAAASFAPVMLSMPLRRSLGSLTRHMPGKRSSDSMATTMRPRKQYASRATTEYRRA